VYTVKDLLGGDDKLAKTFEDGHFCCLYLSPKDYHRTHMPCGGKLQQMIYIPGTLWSVNPTTVNHISELFTKNERVVCLFNTNYGPMVMVLVGATIVGSIKTVWHGVVNPTPRRQATCEWSYKQKEIAFQKGEEMGRFLLGSTVILLWPQSTNLVFKQSLDLGQKVYLHQALASHGAIQLH
jgi:phosphatidylserine decarboxylase